MFVINKGRPFLCGEVEIRHGRNRYNEAEADELKASKMFIALLGAGVLNAEYSPAAPRPAKKPKGKAKKN